MLTIPSPLAAKWKPSDRRILCKQHQLAISNFVDDIIRRCLFWIYITSFHNFTILRNIMVYEKITIAFRKFLLLGISQGCFRLTQRAWRGYERLHAAIQRPPARSARPKPSAGEGSTGRVTPRWRRPSCWQPC